MDTVEDSSKAIKRRAGEILSEWLRNDTVELKDGDEENFPSIVRAMAVVECLRDAAETIAIQFVESPLMHIKAGEPDPKATLFRLSLMVCHYTNKTSDVVNGRYPR